MSTLRSPTTPSRSKQTDILAHLRGQIISGQLLPGVRLPTRSQLERHFRASPLTVQRAFDKLSRDGFVEARGRQGTFVADDPPHLTHFGLVFPNRAHGQGGWSRFWIALQSEAQRLATRRGQTLTTYYYDGGHIDSPDYQRLLADVMALRVGGLIFATPPVSTDTSPVIHLPGIPRVGVISHPVHNIPGVYPKVFSFADRALEYLASRNRRRVAFITPGHTQEYLDHITATLRRCGLETRPYWNHPVWPELPQTARGVAELLVRLPAKERPDALVITDDNLVDESVAGLMAAGARVPQELEVVAHWNFPTSATHSLPIRRLGFDCRDVVEKCVAELASIRRGEAVPPQVDLPAMFEDEIAARRAIEQAAESAGRAARAGNK